MKMKQVAMMKNLITQEVKKMNQMMEVIHLKWKQTVTIARVLIGTKWKSKQFKMKKNSWYKI